MRSYIIQRIRDNVLLQAGIGIIGAILYAMAQLIALLFVASVMTAATVTVCASGCTTTSLQTAWDTLAACGDTVTIKSTEPQLGNYHLKDRSCTDVTPITTTSDRAAWLPFVGTRITPSHLANMAIIRTNNTSPALDGVLTAGVPPKHWKFIGVAFTTTATGGAFPDTYALVNLTNYLAVDATQLPDDITCDRCYFYTSLPNGAGTGSNVTNAISVEISNFTVKNSFFGDFANPGQEAHNLFILTTPGPVTSTNNFFTVSGIPIFSGGAIPDYPVTPANINVQYNYFWRPWKWNSDPLQPFYADFLTNGSYAPCLKNLGEFKFADTVTWKYNGHENMWSQVACQSQNNGFTHTIRTTGNATFYDATMGVMDFVDTTHVHWNGAFNVPDAAALTVLPTQGRAVSSASYGVCPNITGGVGILCRPFASYDNATKIITVTTPFPSAPGGTFPWWISYDGGQTVNAVTVESNVYKNVSKFMSVLGSSVANGMGNAGRVMNSSVRNNLIWNPSTYMDSASCFFGTPAEEGFATDPTNYVFAHNTCYSANPYRWFVQIARITHDVQNRQPKFATANLDNNIAGPSATTGAFAADDFGGNIQTGFPAYFSGATFRNNGMPGIDSRTCAPETCTGNLYAAWVPPFANSSQGIFVVKPGHAYAAAGTTGLNLGADFAKLAKINNLKVNGQLADLLIAASVPVINTSKVALLEWDLSGPIQDAGATQPCVVEVSISQDLHNDLHTYTVINALRPDLFFQPDSTASTNAKLNNPVVANAHVSFPIGKNATVTGDDGIAHDLALLPNTIHYGRAMCYGDTVQFWFGTAVSSSAASSFNVSQIVPAAADHYRISYGATAAFGTNLDVVNATPAATTATVPISADTFVYWKPTYRASGVQIGPVAPVTYIQVN